MEIYASETAFQETFGRNRNVENGKIMKIWLQPFCKINQEQFFYIALLLLYVWFDILIT